LDFPSGETRDSPTWSTAPAPSKFFVAVIVEVLVVAVVIEGGEGKAACFGQEEGAFSVLSGDHFQIPVSSFLLAQSNKHGRMCDVRIESPREKKEDSSGKEEEKKERSKCVCGLLPLTHEDACALFAFAFFVTPMLLPFAAFLSRPVHTGTIRFFEMRISEREGSLRAGSVASMRSSMLSMVTAELF